MSKLAKALLASSRIGDVLGIIPGVHALYGRLVWRRMPNLVLGAYGSFAEAEAAAARLKPVGWNDRVMANLLVGGAFEPADETEVLQFQPSFYPIFHWLGRVLAPGAQLVDFGGAGGIAYELARRYQAVSSGARWHVVDLPEMVSRGLARHAADSGETITFGTSLAAAPAADVLLASGCLQYLRDPLGASGPGFLDELVSRPRHLLINKIPLTEGPSFVTMQNLLQTASPYHVFNRSEFMRSFEARGYALADEWQVPEISIDIPFRSRLRVPNLVGQYLIRA